MTVQGSKASPVRYFHCAGCGRWASSTYREELLRTGTARVDRGERHDESAEFEKVKGRLAVWMARLEESDPFHVLGLPPSASEETVRARFHDLAFEHHPDRGGDAAKMRRVLAAYDRIRRAKPAASSAQASAGSGSEVRPYRNR
jgi:hypothetical protein